MKFDIHIKTIARKLASAVGITGKLKFRFLTKNVTAASTCSYFFIFLIHYQSENLPTKNM